MARNAAEALAMFGVGEEGLAMAMDEEDMEAAPSAESPAVDMPLPSTILDCREAAPRLVRPGVLTLRELGLG